MALQELPLTVVHLAQGSSREEKRSVALALLLVFTREEQEKGEGQLGWIDSKVLGPSTSKDGETSIKTNTKTTVDGYGRCYEIDGNPSGSQHFCLCSSRLWMQRARVSHNAMGRGHSIARLQRRAPGAGIVPIAFRVRAPVAQGVSIAGGSALNPVRDTK